MIRSLRIRTEQQGMHEITDRVHAIIAQAPAPEGLCTLFVQHTSASLVIQENADPSARRDLEAWMMRLVPEGAPEFSHVAEGPDDMPAHIKTALTNTSLNIPYLDNRLLLGTWQGIYLWEHRAIAHTRIVVVQTI